MSAPRIRTPGQLKVPELKEELRKRGITPKGLKKDLVEKLEEVLRNEGQDHIDNSPNCNLDQSGPVGQTSPQQDYKPLPLADSETHGYGDDSLQSDSADYTSSQPISANNNSPPPDLGYTPLPDMSDLPPQGADTQNMHFNSPLQVADLSTHGDFGRKTAEGNVSEWDSSAANVHGAASMVIPSASEPASAEVAIQKREMMDQLDFTSDEKENAFCADDSVITGTVDKYNESGVYESEPKVFGVAVCHVNQPTDNKAEVSPTKALLTDERNIASHLSANVVEKHSNIVSSVSEVLTESEDVRVQCTTLGPVSDGFEVEDKINSETTEVVHITEDNGDHSHPQRVEEQKSEEQEDKGNCLTAQRDNIFKLTKIGPASAEETSCKVTTVPEEPMEHEAVQINCKAIRVPEELMECEVAGTNCDVTKVLQEPREHEAVQNQSINTHLNALEFKYEPRDSCHDSGSVHLGSGECSVTEVLTESEDVHVQCRALGPLSAGLESEASEKSVVHIAEDNADYSQQQRIEEQKSEEEDKGNILTTDRENIIKLNKVGPSPAEKANCKVITVFEEPMEHEAVQTNCKLITVPEEPMEHEAVQTICKVITVPEEPMEHEAVQTNFKATTVPEEPMEQEVVQNQAINNHLNALELKYEPGGSCKESGAAQQEQNMMDDAPSMRADRKECINDENNRDKVPKMSETDPQYDCEQMFSPNSVREHTEPEYMWNQYSSLSRPVNAFESKPTANLEELEADQLKHNTSTDNHDMGSSGLELEEAEIKEQAPASQTDQISKLNKTDLNLDDHQTVDENVQSQYVSSCSTSKDVPSEHTTNSELLEAAQCKQNTSSADYTMGESEPKYEEQEDKGNAMQIQNDEGSISILSNTLLEEKQQFKIMPDKEQVNPVAKKSHQSSFNPIPSGFELMPRNNFEELEAEGPEQKGEEYHQPIQMVGDQEPEEQVKEGTPFASQRKEVLQSSETDPSMAEKGNHIVISLPEVSVKPEYLPNKSILDSSVSRDLKSKPTANIADIEDEHEHLLRVGKQGNEGQKNSVNESRVEAGSCSRESFTDEWKQKSQLPMSQSKMDLEREGSVRSKPLKLSSQKTEEMVPMDVESVDSEVQTRGKQKDHGTDADAEARQEPAKRQRRWNSGNNLLSEASNTKPLTTDTLKDIIPENAIEIPLGSSSLDSPVSPLATKALHSLSKATRTSFSRPAPPPLKSDSNDNGENKKPRIVPPPVRSPTISLKIERFLRPFTIKALKELLSETGTIRYFWIDQIKTHCYVTYSSVEEATATRYALYNLKWPIVGGRLLIAEFVDPDEVKLVCEGQSADVINAPNPMPPKNSTQGSSSLALQGSSAQALPPPPQSATNTKQTLALEREPEPAIYTLDDLFKKTRAKPHIYYLPLSEEQVISKLAAKGREQQNQQQNQKVSHL